MPELENAQQGLTLIKDAIVDYIREHPNGVTNAAIARDLRIESDYEGGHHSYLSWSVLGLLLREGRIHYEGKGRSKLYFITKV